MNAKSKSASSGPDGVLVVDKPSGWTSHDVVARVRRVLGTSKVGHAGTLDPGAKGVLVLGVGRATRLLRFVSDLPKSYEGEAVFGSRTSTLDNEGEVIEEFDMSSLTIDQVRGNAAQFVGDIDQVPPMVSAIKVGGRRLHELARQGVEVERKARSVRVSRFDVVSLVSAHGPVMSIEVDCSSGTYVRSLVDDLGTALGGGAHLRNLNRTAIGPFTLAQSQRIEGDPREIDGRELALLAPSSAVSHLSEVKVDDDVASLVATGRSLACAGESATFEGPGPWALIDEIGELIAVYERSGDRAKPAVVLIKPNGPSNAKSEQR